ncbi:hypothetical protein [Dysgonomonas sp. BGC7]|uniref:hypothetical protein n=1 Tax=Dysgonomonas sp. BGC7 TaxID=1658008 RepID=UPI000A44B6D1|nr:hypothetical protein [Dysgonomonas sp. BGC7]MBD8389305.1 hypothetical protein [Dysgonomonas sp. BGC7]
MDKIIRLAKKNWPYLVGGLIGGAGGYIYWYYIGCSTGTCPITASPTMSILWGTLLGATLLSMFFSRTDRQQ